MKTEGTERQKCIEVLQAFSTRLEGSSKTGRTIQLDWQACGVLWSYLAPAVEMLKADNRQTVSPPAQNSAERVDEGPSAKPNDTP